MTIRGVNGVLQTLLAETTAPKPSRSTRPKKRKNACAEAIPAHHPTAKARTGRPPQPVPNRAQRQKVTFRIRPDLIERYREWSWDARMSVSHLVEAALDEYFTRRAK
jgi:hypothetical protein